MTIKQLRKALEDNLSATLDLSSNAPVGFGNTEIIPSQTFLTKLQTQINTLTKLQQTISPKTKAA
jgi:hypothetical protein